MSEGKKPKPITSPGGIIQGNPDTIIYEMVELHPGEYAYARSDQPDKYEPELADPETGKTYTVPKYPLPFYWPSFPKPESYRDPEYLFAAHRAHLEDHVEFRDKRILDVLAACNLASYRMEDFTSIGYPYFLGPINSGKTTALEAEAQLCYRGIMSTSMSVPSLYRLVDHYHPTILQDESQIMNDKEKGEQRAIINAGYRRGAPVYRNIDLGKDWHPKAYDCFSLKLLASTDTPWPALMSRAILVRMSKKRPGTRLKKPANPESQVEARTLRGWSLQYRFDHALDYHYERLQAYPEPTKAEALVNETIQDPRIQEIAQPLIVVAPAESHEPILSFFLDLERDDLAEERTGEEAAYTQAIIAALGFMQHGQVSTKTIRDGLMEPLVLDDRRFLPSINKVSRKVKSLGLRPVQFRDSQGNIVRGFEVTSQDVARLSERYLPLPPESVTSVTSVTKSATADS